MGKTNLTPEEYQKLVECMNSQTDVPEDILVKLSPSFFDKLRQAGKFDFKELDKYKIPTIEYAGKRPESIILAQAAITGGAAPLQIVRSFANGKNGDWKNLIVQGDNLQFLKTCYMNQDPLIKDKVKGKVKLVYIDPPFATESDFGSSEGVESYADRIARSEFIESLRERLVYMRELLAPEGALFIHFDQKMGHYAKVILDEIFGKQNFTNEIVWRYRRWPAKSKCFQKMHDVIFWYCKAETSERHWQQLYEGLSASSLKQWKGKKRTDITSDKGTRHSEIGDVDSSGVPMSDVWEISQITAPFSEFTGYPTQKPEALVERFILSTTKSDDLVMDMFSGSGTTAAVAEKLGRRWIVCDFGKHAIYTIQKRILEISDSNKMGITIKEGIADVERCDKCNSVIAENDEYKKCKTCGSIYYKETKEKAEKYGVSPKPFCVVSAGAYDFSRIMDLRKNKDAYITFVLGLFSINRDSAADYAKKHKLANVYAEKDSNPVEVYPVWDDEYLKDVRIDEDYLKDIIQATGGKLKGDYYIITPETCTNISDTTLKNSSNEKVNFKLLKFPYKVLEDVSRQFQIEEQPSSAADINTLISSAGFYFNDEVKIEAEKVKGGFKIAKFKTKILDKNKELYKGLNGLAMILVDVDYDGDIFDMDVAIYSKEIAEDGVVKIDGLTKDSRLIAVDKHGNESKITKIG